VLAPISAPAQLTPKESIQTFNLPDGLECRLFAAEPLLANPTNIDIDAHGRVWVCEGVNYRRWSDLRKDGDRIVVLEDSNGDGTADKSTVFYQGNDVNAALGICVLGNKVIVSCSPNVFVFTDEDGDLKADKKEVLFTGIKGVQHDHGVHAFVFGPDGKLYFNMGNDGREIRRPDGKYVVDTAGNEVRHGQQRPDSKSGPYRQGLIFRCNPDGSEFETVAWNFRNNYEVTVDSFGALWQSDNDDDGNRAVRINYVMEFGNYGFNDEITGAGWGQKRTNLESEIPLRHWHLNDPGVVPNLLQTGAGSPTGICLYEGDLLPEVFRNQMIHCDAGPNVVRAYPVTKDGAGYAAQTVNLIHGGDRWFRPSDVCVAPDGSVFVADWYDPGVGGHNMGDNNLPTVRGRIFRVAPPGAKYQVPKFDVTTPAGAVEALKSPNVARRHLAWRALNQMQGKAEGELLKLWKDQNPRLRARALQLLTKIEGKTAQYVRQAAKDGDADIRITALRIARQHKMDLIPLVRVMVKDSSPQVRRECAIALRHSTSSDAAPLWAELAAQHDGKDRWYLEALGIGADRTEDAFFAAWLTKVGDNWNTPAGRDIVWRSRGKQAPALLAKIILDPETPTADRPRYLRAFDFLPREEREDALVTLAKADHPERAFVAAEALVRLKGSAKLAGLKDQVASVLNATRGKPEFLDLVEQLDIKDRNEDVLRVALSTSDQSSASAIRLLVRNGATQMIERAMAGPGAEKLARALGASTSERRIMEVLTEMVGDVKRPVNVRRAAVRALGMGREGGQFLIEQIRSEKLDADLQQAASDALLTSTNREIREQASKLLKLPPTKDGQPLPSIQELVRMKGKPESGAVVFNTVCAQCHQVAGQGTNFGPALTEIGDKLGKDGLYTAILYPSAGVEHHYEGHVVKIKGGDEVVGILVGETQDELTLRIAGGIVTSYPKTAITSRRIQKESIMPEELQKGMTVRELADLVEYMTTLKKAAGK
jgi:putative membrane-bound dehydrogenase-like protein